MKARDQDKEENQSNAEAPLPAVSANTLARCLGVTPKIIYDLTKEGGIERGSGRLFQLEDSAPILRAPSATNGRIVLILFLHGELAAEREGPQNRGRHAINVVTVLTRPSVGYAKFFGRIPSAGFHKTSLAPVVVRWTRPTVLSSEVGAHESR